MIPAGLEASSVYHLLDHANGDNVQKWLSKGSLESKEKRSLLGFEITYGIDGAHDPAVEVSLVKLVQTQVYPQHVHRASDAVFIIVAGEGLLLSGATKKLVKAGDRVPIPRGTPHGFELITEQCLEFISIQSPPIRNKSTGEDDLHLIDMV